MYVEKKKISGKEYYYLKISLRDNDNKVKTGTIAYLGKSPMTKKEINDKISKIPKSKIEYKKKELKISTNYNKLFLNLDETNELNKIKKEYNEKLKNKDKLLIKNMFEDFQTHYVYNTNAIEGNKITLQETSILLNNHISPRGIDLKDIYDHINEKECLDYILNNKLEINKTTIIDIHQRLLKNIDKRVGSFRAHNVRFLGANFKTTDTKYISADIEIIIKWYNKYKKKLNPLILAGIFHEKFERVHPFYEGNGRTGRMLLNLILVSNKFPPLIIKNKTRNRYYTALDCGHKSDLDKIDENYKNIIQFCYSELITSYKRIFSEWM